MTEVGSRPSIDKVTREMISVKVGTAFWGGVSRFGELPQEHDTWEARQAKIATRQARIAREEEPRFKHEWLYQNTVRGFFTEVVSEIDRVEGLSEEERLKRADKLVAMRAGQIAVGEMWTGKPQEFWERPGSVMALEMWLPEMVELSLALGKTSAREYFTGVSGLIDPQAARKPISRLAGKARKSYFEGIEFLTTALVEAAYAEETKVDDKVEAGAMLRRLIESGWWETMSYVLAEQGLNLPDISKLRKEATRQEELGEITAKISPREQRRVMGRLIWPVARVVNESMGEGMRRRQSRRRLRSQISWLTGKNIKDPEEAERLVERQIGYEVERRQGVRDSAREMVISRVEQASNEDVFRRFAGLAVGEAERMLKRTGISFEQQSWIGKFLNLMKEPDVVEERVGFETRRRDGEVEEAMFAVLDVAGAKYVKGLRKQEGAGGRLAQRYIDEAQQGSRDIWEVAALLDGANQRLREGEFREIDRWTEAWGLILDLVGTNVGWFAERDFGELVDWVDAKTGERVSDGKASEASFPFKLLGIAGEFIEVSGRQEMEIMVERVSGGYKQELERLLRGHEQGVRTRIETWGERKQEEINQMIETGGGYTEVTEAIVSLEEELGEREKRLGVWVKGLEALLGIKLEEEVAAKTQRKKKKKPEKPPDRRRRKDE